MSSQDDYHKDLQQALDEAQEQYRTVFEGIPVGLIIWTLDGVLVESNYSAAEMHGYTPEEFSKLSPADFIHSNSLHLYAEFLKASKEQQPFHCVAQDVRKDGTVFDIEVYGREIKYSGEPHYLALIFDITERVQLESELRHSHKMEAVGHLAGGIAHDFNNLLSVINGIAELGLSKTAEDKEAKNLFQQIHEAGVRAKDLTTQLLAFSRKQVLEVEPLNLSNEIEDFIGILKRLIGDDIRLTTGLNTDISTIRADRGQLQQILINLAVNARDAMPKGGQIIISTENHRAKKAFSKADTTIPAGHYVGLSFSDEGVGIPPEIVEKVFEPFFTTKPVGKGTGLGLSTVYGIVKQHNGYIWIDSDYDSGTTIRILFPVAEDLPSVSSVDSKPQVAEGQQGIILLVEDEELLRNFVQEVLTDYGYTVITAVDGLEAQDKIRNFDGKIDLLLTDVIMPHMNGKQLYESLSEDFPGLKVLYMSGYPRDVITQRDILSEEVGFLRKPFTVSELLAVVKDSL